MFCPNCGANNTSDQNYCRSCGLNLEETAISLRQQIPSAESAELLRYEKRVDTFGKIALGGLATVGATGLATLIYNWLSKLILAGESILVPLFFTAFLIFALLSLLFVYFNEGLKEKRKKVKIAEKPNELKDRQERFELPNGEHSAVASVTEGTTQLLDTKRKTKELV